MSVPRSTVEQRKAMPLASGVLDYFPDALLVVAEVSRIGNEQHHPGEPLHWDKSKSTDEADALMRHLLDRGTLDTDGVRHSAKVAWRALALLQRELDREAELAENEERISYKASLADAYRDNFNAMSLQLDLLNETRKTREFISECLCYQPKRFGHGIICPEFGR